MPYKESPVFSYIQFGITGFFGKDIPVECPPKMLKEYYKEIAKPTRFPLIFLSSVPSEYPILNFIQNDKMPSFYGIAALPMTVLILFLNRKKYIDSSGIRLFTNFYYGIQAIYCLLLFSHRIYTYIWNAIFASNVYCLLAVQEWSDYGPPKHSKIFLPSTWRMGDNAVDYPRMYQWLEEILNLYQKWIKHIFTWLLILHRITTYCACAHAFTFRKWFNFKKLLIYYVMLVMATFLFTYFKKIYGTHFFIYMLTNVIIESSLMCLEVIIHIIISALSVYSVLWHRYKNITAIKELRSFLYFSIIPTIIPAFLLMFHLFSPPGYFPGYSFIMEIERTSIPTQNLHIYDVFKYFAILLSDLKPIYDSLLLFICVPVYRKTFIRVILRKKNTAVAPNMVVSISSSRRQNL